jgi:hypothetical protein
MARCHVGDFVRAIVDLALEEDLDLRPEIDEYGSLFPLTQKSRSTFTKVVDVVLAVLEEKARFQRTAWLSNRLYLTCSNHVNASRILH